MRIRSIKPEFWRSEDVAALDWETRLLFIGLWSYVDDNGVGRDNEKLVMADLFPLEDANPRETLATVSRGLLALSEQGLIVRYTVEKQPLLEITGWAKHQRIDKPNKPRYEPVTSENAKIRDTLAESSRDPRDTLAPGTEEQGNRGTEEQGNRGVPSASRSPASADHAPGQQLVAVDIPDRFDEFWDVYGHKVGRKAAEQKWRTALKKPGVTADLLIAAASTYVTHERTYNEGGRYIAHPSTWLNGERWNDEPGVRQAIASPGQQATNELFDRAMQRARERDARTAAERNAQ